MTRCRFVNMANPFMASLAFMFAFIGMQVHAAPILLKSGTIDVGTAKLARKQSISVQTSVAATTSKYIIQHDGKIRPEWRQSLLDAGARILRYVPENAYLISVTNGVLDVVRDKVKHTALLPYSKDCRIDPSITQSMTTATSNSVLKTTMSLNGLAPNNNTNVVAYVISLFSSDVRGEYVARIDKIAGCRALQANGAVIVAILSAKGVEAVSSFDEVEYIDLWHENKLHNNVAVQEGRMNVESVWPGGSSNLGLTGEGQIVAVADTGLDTGSLSTLHSDVRGRVLTVYPLSSLRDNIEYYDSNGTHHNVKARSTWDDTNGHGTHVVGSVLGDGTKSSSKIKGVAYKAKLLMQSVMQTGLSSVFPPSDLNQLFNQVYTNQFGGKGARIHSNSWGASVAGAYTANSYAVDEFVFSHPDMFIVVSSGNDGVDMNRDGIVDLRSVGAPATAKNCMTVGNAENFRTSGGIAGVKYGDMLSYYNDEWICVFPVNPIYSDYYTTSPLKKDVKGMAGSSSRGPCLDGRIKPDIVAPGQQILSLLSSRSANPDTYYTYNSYYRYMQGTSMSAPLVSGTAALVRQWLVENKGISNPDGATIKALLCAGAKSMTPGQYGTGTYREIPATYPNNVEGWGLVNLGNTLVNARGLVVCDAKVIQHEEVHEYSFYVEKSGSALTFVMAYADAPASLDVTQQLVNDLDLKVVSPSGKIYYPNSRTSADNVNNVEGVRISSAEAGAYRVTVTGTKITMGMSTTLTGGKQNAIRYSLIANGATDQLMLRFGEDGKTIDADGSLEKLSVSANVSWTISKPAAATWLTLSKTSGAGSVSIIYLTVARNTTTSARTATLTLASEGVTRTYTVRQNGMTVPGAPTTQLEQRAFSPIIELDNVQSAHALGYIIYRSESPTSGFTMVGVPSNGSWVDRNVQPEHTYYYRIVATNEIGRTTSESMRFTTTSLRHGTYCVIDVSGGPNATSYPVTYLDRMPAGGWTDEYKTDKIVLRRIDPGNFEMCNTSTTLAYSNVSLSRTFYIGVFEITQRQWELVMGGRPSYFSGSAYAKRPVENVSYAMIRGAEKGGNWPSDNCVDASSFLGLIRKRTGLDFDLPTEVQWEVACRAGTATDYNNGTGFSRLTSELSINMLSRTMLNGRKSEELTGEDITCATSEVGLYAPNHWGLYDMHSNVGEWCLDWATSSDSAFRNTTDYKGPSSGTYRTIRGTGYKSIHAISLSLTWSNFIQYSCSGSRSGYGSPKATSIFTGFRLSLPNASYCEPITVTLDAGYGTTSASNIVTECKGCVSALPMPTRTGYKFLGWFTAENGGERITECTAISGSRTFFAHWQKVATASITFDPMGGVAKWSSQQFVPGSVIGELPSCCRQGYIFEGWYTAKEGGEPIDASQIAYDDLTVYAHWIFDEPVAKKYCVVDLSAGASALSYPVSYLNQIPNGGWSDEYKSSKLVLRRVDPGNFSMGLQNNEFRYVNITLTNAYYIGIFELTHGQWKRMINANIGFFTNIVCRDVRPQESISSNNLRLLYSDSNGIGSLLNRITERTGMRFSLPFQGQWQYACRAGVGAPLWCNNGNILAKYPYSEDARAVGRVKGNCRLQGEVTRNAGPLSGTAPVGSYLPNAWGLYDMHGNVSEILMDQYETENNYTYSNRTEPTGSTHAIANGYEYGRRVLVSSWATGVGNWASQISGDKTDEYTGCRLLMRCDDAVPRVKVTYNAGDGNSAINYQLVPQGGSAVSIPVATREGCDFLGWYTQLEGGTKISSSTVFTEPITVYAHWRDSEPLSVIFNPQGGSLLSQTPAIYPGERIRIMPVAIKQGAVFCGWFTAPSGGSRITSSTIVDSDCTFYAHWQDVTTVKNLFNGASTVATGSPDGWFVENGVLRSGIATHGRMSSVSATISGSANLSFEWKVSSEENFDLLTWYVDDVEMDSISGIRDWSAQSCSLSDGEHTITWVYSKDYRVSSNEDNGYLRNVKIVLTKKPDTPVISSVAASGSALRVVWGAAADTKTYSIYRNTSATRPTTALATGLTATSYSDAAALPGVDYYYWVEAVNAAGSTFSEVKSGYCPVTLSLGRTSQNFAAMGGSANISVTANTSWSAVSSDSWMTLSSKSGTGNGTLSFSVGANTGVATRSGSIVVTAGGSTAHPARVTVSVSQNSERHAVSYDLAGGTTGGTQPTVAKIGDVMAVSAPSCVGYVFAGWSVSSGLNTSTARWGGTASPSMPIASSATRCANGASGTVYFKGLSATPGATVSLKANWTKFEDRTYLVIDLSDGPSASSYPISYLDAVPSGGWSTAYKTTKLVLRRVEAGTFTIGSPAGECGRHGVREVQHPVTLAKPSYVGVFELTQRQWELVMGSNPSYFTNATYRATRPVECVSFNMIRGESAGSEWPQSSVVDKGSFMAKLRAKTALPAFDLPTEAEWEYACRAGMTTALNNGCDLVDGMHDMYADDLVAYYYNRKAALMEYSSVSRNADADSGTSVVDAFPANGWGLYGMHGNVFEWCLDLFAESLGTAALTDPRGTASGTTRCCRSGAWGYHSSGARAAARSHGFATTAFGIDGFRVTLRDYCPVRNPVTVTFNANGGLCVTSLLVVEKGACVRSLPMATMSGHSFVGWYTAAEGGTPVTESTVFSGNTTLWAHWNDAVCTVTFKADDGFMHDACRYTFTKDGTIPVFPLVEKSGYLLDGWYSHPTLGSRVSSNMPICGSRTLYARWKETTETTNSLYCVIDLSSGATSQNYPVTFMDDKPEEGWTDEYKTSKLVLRRIEAGTYSCGAYTNMRLTRPYYMGVFELTQRQWELVMGNRPSSAATDYATRPVERVSYANIRGDDAGTNIYNCGVAYASGETKRWISTPADTGSFVSRIRERTGLRLDLPTEMQWEHACRAGTTTDYNDGLENQSADLELRLPLLGRYKDNPGTGGTSGQTAKVGSYKPNVWELYDMHGNVMEWGLDRPGCWSSDSEDLFGIISMDKASSALRNLRGGSWGVPASWCRSGFRNNYFLTAKDPNYGFRLCATMPEITSPVTLSFDACGGACSVTEQRVGRGAPLKGLPIATRKGYAFSGWFTLPGGGTKVSESTVATADVTLYAHWGREKQYMVVDISSGPDASSYPVSYLDDVPTNGWTTTYKTGKLVLRRILPGKYIFGSPSAELGRTGDEIQRWVTITKPFYLGVFEITQAQWYLVMGTRPSGFSSLANSLLRPVECVAYDSIRGTANGSSWPSSSFVDESSFVGKLRKKTACPGFDLPTESEWEYACRAGTVSALNSGLDLTNTVADANLGSVGRYRSNGGYFPDALLRQLPSLKIIQGTYAVGFYKPNRWGLYDMHGNVKEWCLDWYDTLPSNTPVTDPFGALSGQYRCIRGGGYLDRAANCRSGYRYERKASSYSATDTGFRIALREGTSEVDVTSVVKQTVSGNVVYAISFGGSTADSTAVQIPATWLSTGGVDTSSGVTVDLFKSNGANGIPRYQSYLLGLSPESQTPAEEQLKVSIDGFNDDGTPIISCSPQGVSAHTIYTTMGKASITDSKWQTVNDANKGQMHFFKVKAEVK